MATDKKTRIYNSKEDLEKRKKEVEELREAQAERRDEYEEDIKNAGLEDRILSASPLAYTPKEIVTATPRPTDSFSETVASLASTPGTYKTASSPASTSSPKKKEKGSGLGAPIALGATALALSPTLRENVFNGFGSLVEGLGFGGSSAAGLPPGVDQVLDPKDLGGFVGGGAGEAGAFELGGIGSAGNAILPLAGGAFAIDHLMDFGGKRDNPISGGLRGGAEGAAIGSYFGPMGALAGGGIGALVGVAGSFIKSGKHEDQIGRDKWRNQLKDAGIVDPDYNITLADGATKFNIGVDGGAVLPNGNKPYNVNWDDPFQVEVANMLLPWVKEWTGEDEKARSDLVGYLTNAAISNANGDMNVAKANISAIKSQFMKNQPQQSSGEMPSFGGININYNLPQEQKQPLPMPDLSALQSTGVPKPTPPQNYLSGAAQSFGGITQQL